MNHYDFLEQNFIQFLTKLGVSHPESYEGMIVAHGDKCYCLRENVNQETFNRRAAIYLLTYIHPYSKEVRETENGWIDPFEWVKNKEQEYGRYFND